MRIRRTWRGVQQTRDHPLKISQNQMLSVLPHVGLKKGVFFRGVPLAPLLARLALGCEAGERVVNRAQDEHRAGDLRSGDAGGIKREHPEAGC